MTHILMTIPGNIMYIYFSIPNNSVSTYNVDQVDVLGSVANMTYVLYVIGHAINHVLFCLTNKAIQKETSKILVNCKNMYWTQDKYENKAY